MFLLITYDISHDTRRRAVSKVLEKYGSRVQYSVFECHLSDIQFRTLKKETIAVIDADEDGIRFYMLCKICHSRVKIIGRSENIEDDQFFII